jgi:hypothetical protein
MLHTVLACRIKEKKSVEGMQTFCVEESILA